MSQSVLHSPTLTTVRMVEDTLKNMPGSVMTIPALKRSLPRQVNHNTLKQILEYLEESRKIVMSVKGITWVVNDDPRFHTYVKSATPWNRIVSEKTPEVHMKK